MLITHLDKTPQIHPSAYVAPNATVCGDVIIGAGCRIMFGACVVAEGETLELGENCIVMENAVIRSTDSHPTKIGSHCLIGPHAHLVGCTLEDCVFIATGVSIFHGASLSPLVGPITPTSACASGVVMLLRRRRPNRRFRVRQARLSSVAYSPIFLTPNQLSTSAASSRSS